MLKAITWNQYFTFIGLALVCWYAYVLLRYIQKPAGDGKMTFSPAERSGLFGQDIEEKAEAPDWQLMTQTVTQEIKAVLEEAADGSISEAELTGRIQVLLSNHPHFKDTAYETVVNDFILREAAASGFNLTKEEVKGFWN